MKKYLSAVAVAVMAILMAGCEKKGPTTGNQGSNGSGTAVTATLTVTDIADNSATITVSSNSATKAKLVKFVRSSSVTVDTSNDIQLISWIESNGVDVNLPYTETVTDIPVGNDMFTAIAVYNAQGRAVACKYVVWTPVGKVDGWSTENNPGSLGEEKWQ